MSSSTGTSPPRRPLPLKNAAGQIVYPGFPADVLFKFRLYSVLNQLLLWSTIGLGFGVLAERVVTRPSTAETGEWAIPDMAQPVANSQRDC